MLRILFGEWPESFSTACRKNGRFQSSHLPFRTCLRSRSVSFITLVASDLSLDSPVTRIRGSVPLSRTRTQAFSVLTLNPNFVSMDESFPRILVNDVHSVGIPIKRDARIKVSRNHHTTKSSHAFLRGLGTPAREASIRIRVYRRNLIQSLSVDRGSEL